MKEHLLIFCLMAATPSLSYAQGALENPVAGSTESGIGVISGWHCTASSISVQIDGSSLGKAGNGTGRNDTASICGRVDTGYSLLFNYNALTPGSHTISLYADGQLFETRQFNTVQSGGAEFVTGISKTASVADFPSTGKSATLKWSQAKQNFVVTGTSITGLNGGALYTQHCASCHEADPTTNKYNILKGVDASVNTNAIRNNMGSMGYLSTLTAEEINAITAWIQNPLASCH